MYGGVAGESGRPVPLCRLPGMFGSTELVTNQRHNKWETITVLGLNQSPKLAHEACVRREDPKDWPFYRPVL